MRQYMGSQEETLEKVVCNRCGRELKLKNGMVQEGVYRGDARWGYFSGMDAQRHRFDLCEDCYKRMIEQFCIPVTVEEETELL